MVSASARDSVERLIDAHQLSMSYVPLGEVSLRTDAEATFGKTLLLAAGSYFEARLSNAVYEVFLEATGGARALADFVWSKAVTRRYHDWFAWDNRNANRFFSAFGSDFQSFMQDRIGATVGLEESIRAFMEIGSLRNVLAHDDLASYPLTKTVPEIVELYDRAKVFVERFPIELRNFLRT